MKLLCIDSGANYSTSDVFDAYMPELRDLGHDIGVYNLSTRLNRASSWLKWCWRKAGSPPDNTPNGADVFYWAGAEAVLKALGHLPDWAIIWSGMYFLKEFLTLLRRTGTKVALVYTESPYDDPEQADFAEQADLVLTNERTSVELLRQHCPRVEYLPVAYDARRHRPGLADAYDERQRAAALAAGNEPPEPVPSHDVVFVGFFGFQERWELLNAVDWSGIDLGLYGAYDEVPSRLKLRRYIKGGITPNDRTAALYDRARIGLNLYRSSMGWGRGAPQIEHAESLNPRAYELAACGAFHLSQPRAELAERFGEAVPTFHTAAQLEQLIRHYLDRPAEREQMAACLPRLVEGQSYAARARQLVACLE